MLLFCWKYLLDMALQMAVRLQSPPTTEPPSSSSKVISGAQGSSDGASTLWLHLQVALGYDLTLPLILRKRIISVLLGCCCEVTSVVSDSVRPHRRQPTRLPCPWDSPGKNTGAGCHFLLQRMKVKSESEVAQSCPTLATPRTAAHQAPASMGFSRQESWSGVPLPSPPPSLKKSKPVDVCPRRFSAP